jgi:hypothetical protein
VWIFIGLLLVVIFIVGMVCEKNPAAFSVKYRYASCCHFEPLFLASRQEAW